MGPIEFLPGDVYGAVQTKPLKTRFSLSRTLLLITSSSVRRRKLLIISRLSQHTPLSCTHGESFDLPITIKVSSYDMTRTDVE